MSLGKLDDRVLLGADPKGPKMLKKVPSRRLCGTERIHNRTKKVQIDPQKNTGSRQKIDRNIICRLLISVKFLSNIWTTSLGPQDVLRIFVQNQAGDYFFRTLGCPQDFRPK